MVYTARVGTMKGYVLVLSVVAATTVVLIAGGYLLLTGGSRPPTAGTVAPDFTLHSQEGRPVSLSGVRGQWVVLYFYPKDFTSGCTIEAHNFQRDLEKYGQRNAVILGVSVQDEATHKEFCAKEGLDFRLLADTKNEVSRSYGSLINLGIAKLSSRHTFLIDPQGIIQKVWLNVDVHPHSAEILAALDELQKNRAASP